VTSAFDYDVEVNQVDGARVPIRWSDRIAADYLPDGELPPMALTPELLAPVRASLTERKAAETARTDPRGVAVSDGVVPVADRAVRVRVYRGTAAASAPWVLWIHSGALLLGNLDIDNRKCLDLARMAECVIVSVDYRLAPEHPYPAALDDCFGVLSAVLRDPVEHGVDASRVAIAGCSAGAGLAAALALRARDELPDHPLRLQLLHQPMLDARCGTASMAEFDTTPYFDSPSARFAWHAYLAGPEGPGTYGSPAEHPSLAGVAPAFVCCAEVDPLRDEGVEYARRLWAAGVEVELHVYPRTCHGFDSVAPDAPGSLRSAAEQAQVLVRALA
jgi:acetyl esterase/lipase